MDNRKKNGMRNKIMLGIQSSGILLIIWQIFVLKLLEKGKISTFVAILCIVGVFAFVMGSLALQIRFFLGKIMSLMSGTTNEVDEIMDEKVKKLTERNDEIGEIAQKMQSVFSSVGEIMNGIKSTSAKLNEVSESLDKMYSSMVSAVGKSEKEVWNITKNTELQAEQIAMMKEKIDSISMVIEFIVNNVELLMLSSETMRKYDKEAELIMKELVKINQQSSIAMEDVKQQTGETHQAAQKIRAATEIIAGISNQTNLLALNASIEAARAGEHGKGFAVVAEQIRTLADQSKQSTEDIGKIVESLLKNADISVDIAENVSDAFEKQSAKIQETEKIFSSLNEEVGKVGNFITEITGKVQELNIHKEVIENEIMELATESEENVQSAEITKDSVNNLRQAVEECNDVTEVIVAVSKEQFSYMEKIEDVFYKSTKNKIK